MLMRFISGGLIEAGAEAYADGEHVHHRSGTA